MDINLIIVAVYSYLLGSIPFGLVLTKIFLKKERVCCKIKMIMLINLLHELKMKMSGVILNIPEKSS